MKSKKALIVLMVMLFSSLGLYFRLENECKINPIQLFTLIAIGVIAGVILAIFVDAFRNRER